MECPACGADAVIQDEAMSSLMCLECGVVVSDRPLTSALQIAQNSDGCAQVTGQFVAHQGFHTAGYSDDNISVALQAVILRRQRLAQQKVSLVCSRIGLSGQAYSDMVCDLMGQITRQRWGSGRWIDLLAGGCAYVVARQNHKPITLLDIADAISVNVFLIGRVFIKIQQYLRCELPVLDPALHLTRICSRLTIPAPQLPKVVDTATRLLVLAHGDWLTVGRRPAGVIAAALRIACDMLLPADTVNETCLAGVSGVSRTTIRQRVLEIKETLVRLGKNLPWGETLTVKNVLQHTSDILAFKEVLQESTKLVDATDPSPVLPLPPSLKRSLDERQRKIDRFERAAHRINSALGTEPGGLQPEHDLEMERVVLHGNLGVLLGESQSSPINNHGNEGEEENISDSEIEGYLKTMDEITAMAEVMSSVEASAMRRTQNSKGANKRVRR